MIRAEFIHDPLSKSTTMYLLAETGNSRCFLRPGPDGYMVAVPFDVASAPATGAGIVLPDGAMEAMADALARIGVRTDSDAKIEGTLEATRAHLADMRALLKLK